MSEAMWHDVPSPEARANSVEVGRKYQCHFSNGQDPLTYVCIHVQKGMCIYVYMFSHA